ncbi:protein translocase subunit SecD [Patescibacteria group bacterium]
MLKTRILAIFLILFGIGAGFFVYISENPESKLNFPFKLGLDLAGGTHLVYKADISELEGSNVEGSVSALRDVIERRVNLFGVSEPLVQTEKGGAISEDYRLIVELPGVTDVNTAVNLIGQTPLLEFKKERPEEEVNEMREAYEVFQKAIEEGREVEPDPILQQDMYLSTGLTGRYLDKAQLQFDQTTGEPTVLLSFNKEGREMFAKITEENIGKVLAIYLDGVPISTPVIRQEIKDGNAEISGGFDPQEAKVLVRDLNYGALPVPIELISTQSVGASLGSDVLNKGINAGLVGLLVVMSFLVFYYRIPGLLATVSLLFYVILMLTIFKLASVTLTSAGIAGFIMSIGMAVDANILIFERTKEELRKGSNVDSSIREGFARAWLSIRDSNLSSIITAIILFWFGTSLVEGFALTFGVGILISMFTAITVTRTFLLAFAPNTEKNFIKFLFGGKLKSQ